jgi:hypothetical protein
VQVLESALMVRVLLMGYSMLMVAAATGQPAAAQPIAVVQPIAVMQPAATAQPQYGMRLDGAAVRSLAAPGTKAVVLFFVATDCGVSNRTFPEMRRVREEFADKGIRVWFVYPNVGETAAGVKQHQAEFDAGGDALLDAKGALTRLAGAKVTPSVAVLVPRDDLWKPVYVGRIDDRYVRLGLQRPQVQTHFAERVVREVLEGRPVERAVGMPVGCGIMQPDLETSR